MLEVAEGCAVLEDVDEDTFVYFSQFAYTGNYTILKPMALPDAPAAPDTPALPDAPAEKVQRDPSPPLDTFVTIDEISDQTLANPPVPLDISLNNPVDGLDEGRAGASISKKSKSKGKTAEAIEKPKLSKMLWEDFRALSYISTNFSYETELDPKDFLAHARIYVFADKYAIGPLRMLSLHKLHCSLVAHTLSVGRIGKIVQLLRWTYQNTCDGSSGSAIDELRSLTALYAACKIKTLAKSVDYEVLLEENGALGKNIIKMLLKRLV